MPDDTEPTPPEDKHEHHHKHDKPEPLAEPINEPVLNPLPSAPVDEEQEETGGE